MMKIFDSDDQPDGYNGLVGPDFIACLVGQGGFPKSTEGCFEEDGMPYIDKGEMSMDGIRLTVRCWQPEHKRWTKRVFTSRVGPWAEVRLGGDAPNPWTEYEDHPVEDWRMEVINDETRAGYLAWRQHKLTIEREEIDDT